MKQFFLMILAGLFSQASSAEITCPSAIPKDICQFEKQVYTATDFKNTEQVRRVYIQLKELMMSHVGDQALIQEHILNLADQINEEAFHQRAPKSILAEADGKRNTLEMLKKLKVWEARHGQIVPLDWHLPDGFVIAVSNLERSYDVATGHVRFGLSFFAILARPLEIEQLQVVKYGGAVVIDKAAGIGTWSANVLESPHFSGDSWWQETPLQDGLYTLNIKVKNQAPVSGWFYLHGTSATSPVVVSPQVNERIHSATPTFSFQDFRSDVLAPADQRKRSVQVFHEGESKLAWRTDIVNPKPSTEVRVAGDPNESGEKFLAPGSYRLNLVFEERSYFGDMLTGRLSNTTVPFVVTK
jgi:hypothetical protein